MESLQTESKRDVNEKDEWHTEKSSLRVEETDHSIAFSLSANSTLSEQDSLSENYNKQPATRVSQRGELKSFKQSVADTNSTQLEAEAVPDRNSLKSSATSTVTLHMDEDARERAPEGDNAEEEEDEVDIDREEDKEALSSSEANLEQIKENFRNFISSNKLNEQMAEIIRNILITRPENVFLYAADCFRVKVG